MNKYWLVYLVFCVVFTLMGYSGFYYGFYKLASIREVISGWEYIIYLILMGVICLVLPIYAWVMLYPSKKRLRVE